MRNFNFEISHLASPAPTADDAREELVCGVRLTTTKGEPVRLTNAVNVESPEVVRR